MTVINESAIACVYEETFLNAKLPWNDERDGLPAGAYNFTWDQMLVINDTLHEMVDKYSTGGWATNPVANILIENLEEYINATLDEMEFMTANPGPPTMAPGVNYTQELVQWYSALGRGNRYDKDKVQALANYWPYVRCLYPPYTDPCEEFNGTDTSDPMVENMMRPAEPIAIVEKK